MEIIPQHETLSLSLPPSPNRKVWSQISSELHDVVSLFGDRLVQDSMEMLSLSSRESSAAATQQRWVGF